MTIPTRKPLPRSPLADWWRIIAMGVLLAALVWVTFFQSSSGTNLGSGPPIAPVQVAIPKIDQELLRTARDAEHGDRLVLEPDPLAHLLEKTIDIVPSVAEALGKPEQPVPIAHLRTSPQTYRGAYLWYTGRLTYLSPGKSGHPVTGYRIHEGALETQDGETVLFRVSLPPRVQVDDFVRIEGFFLKLRDSAANPRADMAPLLVGPELFPDYPPWDPVTELDPEVFAPIQDGIVVDGVWVDEQDAARTLDESEDIPLWTLASYANARRGGAEDTLGHWRGIPAFVTKDQLDEVKRGEVAAGTPFRLLGTFVMARWFAARPNPAGIRYWSQAWIQIRDLGGKIVPVWIPRKVEGYQFNQSLEVRAYYLRRFIYDLQNQDGKAFTPLFVAADLDRFSAGPEHPMTKWAKAGFAAAVAALIALFFFIARRDGKASAVHEQEMIERRRKRRAKANAAPETATS
jgi:hypothetical protein